MASSIEKIPNSISGDGSSFVAQLKKALADLRSDVETLDESDTGQNCQSVVNVTLTQRKQGNDNFIDVSWEKESVYGYKEAFVFYRPINSTKWQLSFVTEETSGVIEGVSVGTRYAVKVVPHNIDGGYDKNPKETYIDVVSSMGTPSTPTQFFVNFDSGEGHWEWKYEGAYDFFELRTDTNVGVTSEYLLARTNQKEVFKEPNILQGTAYLYVRNNFGVYSVPAETTFDISEENRPPKPSISRGANGLNIHMTPNENYTSYVVQVEELEYETEDNPFYLARTRGALRTRYRWRNGTSYSEWSNWTIVNVSELIDTDDLCDNCITADKLSAGSVTAGKLFAGNIDLAGKLAIVGGAVVLNENGLRCTALSGDSVIVDDQGLRFVDSNDNEFSAIKRVIMGEAEHNRTITFTKPFVGSPKIVCNPKEIQVGLAEYSQSNVVMVCKAINVSNTGFTMQCYTQLGVGSSNTQSLGTKIEPSHYTGEYKFYGYDKMYNGYTDYIYTAPESASEVSFRFTVDTYAPPRDREDSWDDNWGFGVAEVFIDGTQVWTSGVVGYVATFGRKTTIITTDTFKLPSNRQITIKFWKSYYRVWDESKATFVIDWVKTNVNSPTIISTGTASFIAVDTGEYYV